MDLTSDEKKPKEVQARPPGTHASANGSAGKGSADGNANNDDASGRPDKSDSDCISADKNKPHRKAQSEEDMDLHDSPLCSKMKIESERNTARKKKLQVSAGCIIKSRPAARRRKAQTMTTPKRWQVHLKASFDSPTSTLPSRRFTIAYRTPFKTLKEKLQDMFKLSSDVEVSYKDEAGDMVALTSDNELAELFAVSRSNSICPVLVTVSPIKT